MFVEDLKLAFLKAARACDKRVCDEIHGRYNITDFYNQRITNNHYLTPKQLKLLKSLYTAIQSILKGTKVSDRIIGLTNILVLWNNTKNQQLNKILSSLCQLIITHYQSYLANYYKPLLSFERIEGNLNQITVTASQKHAELAKFHLAYSLSNQSVKSVILKNYNDNSLLSHQNFQHCIPPTLTFIGCSFTEETWCAIFDAIKHNSNVRHLTLDESSLSNINKEHLEFCIAHKLELLSITIINVKHPHVNTIINDFLSQRYRLLHGVELETIKDKSGLEFLFLNMLKLMLTIDKVKQHELANEIIASVRTFKPKNSIEDDIYKSLFNIGRIYTGESISANLMSVYKKAFYIYNVSLTSAMLRKYSTNLVDFALEMKDSQVLSDIYINHVEGTRHEELRQLIFAAACIIKSSLAYIQLPNDATDISPLDELIIKCLYFYCQKQSPKLNQHYHYAIYSGLYRLIDRFLAQENSVFSDQSLRIEANGCTFAVIEHCFKIFNKLLNESMDSHFKLLAVTTLRARFSSREMVILITNHKLDRNRLYGLKEGLFPSNNFGINIKNDKLTSTQIKRFISLSEIQTCEYQLKRELNQLASKYLTFEEASRYEVSADLLKTKNIPKTAIADIYKKISGILTMKIFPVMLEVEDIDFLNTKLAEHDAIVPNYMQSFLIPFSICRSSSFLLQEIANGFRVITDLHLDFQLNEKSDINSIVVKKESIEQDMILHEISKNTYNKVIEFYNQNKIDPEHHFKMTGRFLQNPSNLSKVDESLEKQYLQQKNLELSVCNARLIRHEEFVEAFLDEMKHDKPHKKPKKHKHQSRLNNRSFTTLPRVQKESPSADQAPPEDKENTLDILLSEFENINDNDYFTRAQKLVEIITYYQLHTDDHETIEDYVEKARRLILLGKQDCENRGVTDTHFNILDFALNEEHITSDTFSVDDIKLSMKQHRYLQAIAQLESATKNIFKRKLLMMLSELYIKTGQFNLAKSCLLSIINESSVDDLAAKMKLVHVYYYLNQPEAAEKLLSDYDGEYLDNKLINDARMHGYQYDADYQSANQLLYCFYQNLNTQRGKLAYAIELYRLGEYSQADTKLALLIQSNLTSEVLTKALYFSIKVKIALAEYQDALSLADKLEKYDAYNALLNRSEIYRISSQFVEADKCLTEAIAAFPERPNAYLHKAYLCLDLKQYQEAQDICAKAIELFPCNTSLAKLKHRVSVKRTVTTINDYRSIPQPDVKVLPVKHLHFEFESQDSLDKYLKQISIPKWIKSLSDRAKYYNLKLLFTGSNIYHILHGRPVNEIACLLIGDLVSCRHFVKMHFNSIIFNSEYNCHALYKNYVITLNIESKLPDLVTFANLQYSTLSMLLIDHNGVVQDPRNVRYELLMQHKLHYDESFAITQPVSILKCIREALDAGLELVNLNAILGMRASLTNITLSEWLEELPKVAKSKAAFDIIMQYCFLGVFEFLVPRAHVLAVNTFISSKNFFQALIQHLDNKAMDQAMHPGLCLIGQLLILLDFCDMFCIHRGQEPEMLIEEFRFKDQLSVWQRHELLKYVKKYQSHFVKHPAESARMFNTERSNALAEQPEYVLRQ